MILFQPIFAVTGTHATRKCGRCGRRRQAYEVRDLATMPVLLAAADGRYRAPDELPPVCHDCMCAIAQGAAYPAPAEAHA